jgi:hypothetical protein
VTAGSGTFASTAAMNSGESSTMQCSTLSPFEGEYTGSLQVQCTAGSLRVVAGGTGACAKSNPCTGNEDNCDQSNSQCRHTGAGTHDCDCNIDLFGVGYTCTA